jgi:HSP20 family protein
MVPGRWLDPFADVDLLSNFDRMVDRVFGGRESLPLLYPADIWEDEENIHIEMELPGVTAENISLSYEDGLLRIEGERVSPERKGTVYMSERQYGRFSRTFQLPNVIDQNDIQANFRDGMLMITCAKKPETKPHKIEIRTG